MTEQLAFDIDLTMIVASPRLKSWFDDRNFDAFGRFIADRTGLYRVSFDQVIRNAPQFAISTRRVQIDFKYYKQWILFIELDSFLIANFAEKVSSNYLGPKRRAFLTACQNYATSLK